MLILFFGPRPDADVPAGRVVVDYWEKWTGEEGEQMKSIVDDFNNTVGKDKGIYVRYVSTSSITQKTLVGTAAGVPPDIAGLWDHSVVQYAALDALTPLDEMATAHGITEGYYKKAFWEACKYNGKLYALISTPATVALHYNKRIFRENADKLRAAGCDPDRAPATIEELDRYAKALDQIEPTGRIDRTGYLPTEPSWYVAHTAKWFGGNVFDESTGQFQLTDPNVVRAYRWIRGYAQKLGPKAAGDFRSGFGNFDSPQNPFLTGDITMCQQGPWMANYIYNLKPSMSTVKWSREVEMTKPLKERLENYEWAVAPFPSTTPGKLVTYCALDTLVIPRGAKHPKEAFEFIAYVNRQDISEKLNKLHCKQSPLARVSDDFLNNHPNPYIKVFEDLANSPDAFAIPKVPIWPEVAAELDQVAQKMTLKLDDPQTVLAEAQARLQQKYDRYVAMQKSRRSTGFQPVSSDMER
jgi:multiple sugar transport system substrate-binding protein